MTLETREVALEAILDAAAVAFDAALDVVAAI